jgi:predicted transglutaminase-like cysteine proteinase
MTRPVKGTGDRKRRVKVQRKRLAALGVPEEKLRVMNTKQVRTLLRKPKLAVKRVTLGRI